MYRNNEDEITFADLPPKGPEEVKNTVIGVLTEGTDCAYVIPDKAFKEAAMGRIKILAKDQCGAPFRMTVVCEVLNPDAGAGNYRGRIIEVLGDMGNDDVRMNSVLRQFGLSQKFPAEVTEETAPLPNSLDPDYVDKEIAAGRRDLRGLLTITIDGEEAKDLDDAISIRRAGEDTFELFVHIADVSHYVREGTALDNEALRRGTSVYLCDRVIPMLPPKLSNGICSLNPEADRLTLTACMTVGTDGITRGGEVFESVIRSDRRMSYNECFRIFTEPKDTDGEEYGGIIPMLNDMRELYEAIRTMRERKGAVNFSFPETHVELDNDNKPVDIYPYPINFCHGIIEQFMICANEFIAKKFAMMNYPFVYRVHESPDPIKMKKFVRIARNYGAVGKLPAAPSPLDISLYKQTIKDETAAPLLDNVLLRSMAKAVYSNSNLGHFGLASEFYCHFTSPIRRYPDLYIHRIIKSWLHNENRKAYFNTQVYNVAYRSSMMEQNSVEAERASVDIMVARYMKEKLGERYEGVISSIINAGMFVTLPNSVEGFVAFRNLRDRYWFDEDRMRAVGNRSGAEYRIGTKVSVIVAAVDTDQLHIDFELLGEKDASASCKVGKVPKKGRKKKRR